MKRPNNWEELLEIAKRQPDLLGAMERVGIPLKRVGSSRKGGKRYQTTTKKLEEGDLSSVVFIENPDGSWIVFDNKQRTGKAALDAISALRAFGGVSFDDAVYLLSGGSPALPPPTPKKIQPKADVAADEPPKPFDEPPSYKEKTRNVIAYLTKTRCIPYELVKALIEGDKLYAGYWKKDINDPDAKKVVKCVFKITDEEGKFVGADSLLPISDYRGKYMASGSDPAYAWNFAWGVDEITKDTPLFFCEAPLDAMSLCAITGAPGVYLSLSGTKDITFLSMLEKLGGTPIICTDHDGGAGDNFAKKYPQYRRMIPPVGKDWNDALKHYEAQGLPYALKPSEKVPKKANGAPTESAPEFEIISGVVDKALANKGNIGEKYNQKRISPVPSDIAQMISVASGGKIDVSQKHIAIHGDRVWHEYRQHSQIEKEAGLNQIPLTAQSIKEAIAAIYDPDIIESVFADKDNPTERQSFVYAKKSSNGHYVVVETVGGRNNPNLTPVMILQFTKTKLKSMLSTGKTFGELFFENDPEKFSALDVEYNKRNRVIVAQFASKEAIASTPHSPRSINSVPQNPPNVNPSKEKILQEKFSMDADASITKAPKRFTSRGLQLPKLVQTIIDAKVSISQNPPNVNPSNQKILKDEMMGLETLPKDEYLENLYKELELCELTIQNKDKLPAELVADAERIKQDVEKQIAEHEIAHRSFTYDELVAKGELQGVVIDKSRQVPRLANGSIDIKAVVDTVKKGCEAVQLKGGDTRYYVSAPDIGRNVQLTSGGITHGFADSKPYKNGNLPLRASINARAALELPFILENSIEVNRKDTRSNLDIPFSRVLIGTVGMEDINGNVAYYAVRTVIEERLNQNAILVDLNILCNLYAVNAKKVGPSGPRGVTNETLPSGSKMTYMYSVTHFLDDVKGVFDDTFSLDVYQRLGVQRNERKPDRFAKDLLYSRVDDVTKASPPLDVPTHAQENSPAPSDDLFSDLKQRVTSAVEGYRNDPQALAEFLAFSASFNNYSAKNLRLIWVQDPHASFVAPASFFKAGMPDENGVPRTQEKIYINKGEKALRIWKPYDVKYVAVPREGQPPELTEYAKLPKELKQRAEAEKWAVKTQVKFRLVPVFDIAQTTAPPEAYPKTFGFGGNVNRDAEQQYLAVKQYAEDVLGCPVSIADLGERKATVRGFFRPDANEIVLSDMLSGDGKLSTLIHEVGHAELHGDMVSNRHKSTAQIELEADMYALMIEAKLGIKPTEARCRHLGAHYEAYMQELAAKLPEGQTLDLNADIDAMNNVLHRYTEQSPLIERYLDRQLSREAQVAATSPENQQKAPKPTVTPRPLKI